MSALLRLLGIVVDSLSREEAAALLLERELRIVWRPLVVEVAP